MPSFHLAPFFAVSLLLLTLAPANSPPPIPALAPELTAKQPQSLLTFAPAAATFHAESPVNADARLTWSSATGSAVARVEVPARAPAAPAVALRWTFDAPLRRGDVFLARFYVRADYARQESGEAMFSFDVFQVEPEWARHILLPLTAGPDWALIEIPFFAPRDAEAGKTQLSISLGPIAQAVQFAHLEVLNFGTRAQVAQLPQTRFTYPGRAADAAWRQAALKRIQKLRTAPLRLRVIDAAGRPVPDARVVGRLVRPTYIWGTAVDAGLILEDSPDAARYRQLLLDLFDTAVLGNGLKWPRWSGSVARRDEALRATTWLESQGLRMRGHNLVWPGDKFSPQRIRDMPAPREGLDLLVREHIRDVMTATKGRMIAWDVINEMMHERDYFNYLPETAAVGWFQVARETDPTAELYLNEYSMLNSSRSPERIALFLALAQRLIAAGAPIDALGIQSHVGRQVRPPEDVLRDLDLVATAGLPVQATEFDINTPDEDLQADYFRDFLIAFYSHPVTTGFTMWGFWERDHWKPDAALIRSDFSEKPALRPWLELARGEWLTRFDLRTAADGTLETRGHLGDYEFTVTASDKTARQMRPLRLEGADVLIQIP